MLDLEPATTAVLVLDFQQALLSRLSPEPDAVVERAADVLRAARQASIPVVWVGVGYRPGHPEIGPRSPALEQAIKEPGAYVRDDPTAGVPGALAPEPSDLRVIKRRIGAFYGTDLELILRTHRIEDLVIFGIATSGAVLSTVRHAFDADYRMVVVGDCCVDLDAGVGGILLEHVIGRQATVAAAGAVVAALERVPGRR